MTPISIIIPTLNEAENLAELLALLGWADEVIVIDSFSKDSTEEIAKQHNCTFYQRKYDSPASQKNWAIEKAKNNWIFILDADERPTLQLVNEIQNILKINNDKTVAYKIKRRNYFMGKRVRFSGWQNDKITRLIHKKFCRYNENQVHEEIIAEGEVKNLKNHLLHFTFKNMEHFTSKMDRYAAWSAQDHDKKTGRITIYHLYFKPAYRFFKHFIWQLGFLDGKIGWTISQIMARSVYKRYVYLLELRKGIKL